MSDDVLKEINKKLKAILIAIVLKEEKTDNKIKILRASGMKSEEIGNIIGMSGRGIRKNKAYKE